MKKGFFKIMATGLVLLAATSISQAAGGRGMGFNSGSGMAPVDGYSEEGKRPGGVHAGMGGTGIGTLIVSEGIDFTVTGEVQDGETFRGVTLLTESGEEVSIHGIGPAAYWESLGYTIPQTGDSITVYGYNVDLNGNSVYIAFSVDIFDDEENIIVTVPLRDEEGTPLMVGEGAMGPMGGGHPPMDILSGTPFDFSGTVTEAALGLRKPAVVTDSEDGESLSIALGPLFYWESLGLSKPAVGDFIVVSGYTLTPESDGMPSLNIAATVTLEDGTEVQLLDDDGVPMWAGERGQGRRF